MTEHAARLPSRNEKRESRRLAELLLLAVVALSAASAALAQSAVTNGKQAGGKLDFARYECQRWAGYGVQQTNEGGIILNSDGTYARLGLTHEKEDAGRFVFDENKLLVTFSTGFYKGYEAHVGRDGEGRTWLDIATPDRAAENRNERAGRVSGGLQCYQAKGN